MTSTLPPQNGILPLPKITFSLPENVDPRDCEKYPNSPYCGGDLIQKIPLGIQAFFSQDSCNFTLNVSPIIAAIATPPIQLTIRSATPECNLPPAPGSRSQQSTPYVPPPRTKNEFYIALATVAIDIRYYNRLYPGNFEESQVNTAPKYIQFRYPLNVYLTGVPCEGYVDITDITGNVSIYFRNDKIGRI